MKRVRLSGKHAFGPNQWTLVDDEHYEELSKYKWKAKPNGGCNNFYAVRNVKNKDGVCSLLRMHRVVLGYEGNLDVDHINKNSLDNRRDNLRVVSQSINLQNMKIIEKLFQCKKYERIFLRVSEQM